ncbi:MAG: hypothetical protein IKS51_10025 [Erysipelotrichaceae bacterium]|nr:hypothetical protein [Erysipelotrichaceae bacterium]
MKRRLLSFLLIGMLMLGLSACGGSGDSGASASKQKQPVGLYMLEYFCDANGEYVPEFNEEPDYDGYPTTELERLYIDKKTYWCEISEDGTGKYHTPFQGDEEMDLVLNFKENQFEYDDYMSYDFRYDPENDAFWYGADDFWYRMRRCTREELDDVFAGKGGSVAIGKAEIGDLVCLGNYDTYPYNEETEPLYWRVISKQDGKLLILCDKLIDSFSFNYNPELKDLDKVTWENCSLREFLNNEFLEMMFTEEERALVQTTVNENKAANEELLEQWGDWEDRDGIHYSEQTYQFKEDDSDTEDKVFLLSYQEILKYFGKPTETYQGNGDYPFTEMEANSKWKAMVTKTVDENAIGYFESDTRYGAWMTRTLSTALNEDGPLVTYITSEGQVFNYYTYAPMFIRPAMWISCGS